ncbi:MAG: hypothetical protein ACRCUY_06295 [Thermoguttaceae bacterium]
MNTAGVRGQQNRRLTLAARRNKTADLRRRLAETTPADGVRDWIFL